MIQYIIIPGRFGRKGVESVRFEQDLATYVFLIEDKLPNGVMNDDEVGLRGVIFLFSIKLLALPDRREFKAKYSEKEEEK